MKMNNVLLILALAIGANGCQNTTLGDSAIKGRVLDYETNKPIEDAIVYVLWRGNASGSAGGGVYGCYHSAAVQTNANGDYEVPAWQRPAVGVIEPRLSQERVIQAYKEGYFNPNFTKDPTNGGPVDIDKYNTIRISKYAGNELAWLKWSGPSGGEVACGFEDDSNRTLGTLVRRLCAERHELLKRLGKPDENCEKPFDYILHDNIRK